MDLTTLSLGELKNILNLIPVEIKRRKKEDKARTLKDLEALATARGFTLNELLGGTKEKTVRPPVAVKYRHPQNVDLTWTGRGRYPKWITEFIDAGGTLEQISI